MRETGCYWINYIGNWMIAYFISDVKIWNLYGFKINLQDHNFDGIDEKQIKRE